MAIVRHSSLFANTGESVGQGMHGQRTLICWGGSALVLMKPDPVARFGASHAVISAPVLGYGWNGTLPNRGHNDPREEFRLEVRARCDMVLILRTQPRGCRRA